MATATGIFEIIIAVSKSISCLPGVAVSDGTLDIP